MHIKPENFQTRLLQWYEQYGRKSLPWQQASTPYKTWLSEIMLQQTQVKTVIPYFQTFIAHFPTIETLATTHLDEVLHLWTGLGYYRRARNLHTCAQHIVEHFQGEFPDDIESLVSLPGIGRSTAGAILSLGFNKKAAILDGNVKRLLTRVFAIEGWPGKTVVEKKLWAIAETLTPSHHNREYSQVTMDLGATLCTRTKPQCNTCPCQSVCLAHQQNREEDFPYKKPKKTMPIKHVYLCILQNEHREILLEKRPNHGIWSNLWSLPESDNKEQIPLIIKQRYGLNAIHQETLPQFRHTFSHYHLEITPVLLSVTQTSMAIHAPNDALAWYDTNNPLKVGLPQPIKRLLTQRHVAA